MEGRAAAGSLSDLPLRPAVPNDLPPEFVERLLPSIGAPWAHVRSAAALHRRLGLAHDEGVSALAARALQISPERALPWLRSLETQPRNRWVPFLVLVLETGVLETDALLPRDLLSDLAHSQGESYERWVYIVLDGCRRALNPKYLTAGIRYATHDPDHRFYRVWGDAPDFDEKTASLLEGLLPSDWAGRELMLLWEICGILPGFSSYVMKTDWGRFTPSQRRRLLRFFTAMRWRQPGPMDSEQWRVVAADLPRLEDQGNRGSRVL